MVANKITRDGTIIEESLRLKDMLLGVQAQVDAVAREAEAALLEGSQQKLGYQHLSAGKDKPLIDNRVHSKTPVLTPHMLTMVLPVSDKSILVTEESRKVISDIIKHQDSRLKIGRAHV